MSYAAINPLNILGKIIRISFLFTSSFRRINLFQFPELFNVTPVPPVAVIGIVELRREAEKTNPEFSLTLIQTSHQSHFIIAVLETSRICRIILSRINLAMNRETNYSNQSRLSGNRREHYFPLPAAAVHLNGAPVNPPNSTGMLLSYTVMLSIRRLSM